MNWFKRKKESNETKVLSLLTPDELNEMGNLPSIAICATFEGKLAKPINFKVNKAFVYFMHQTISKKAPSLQSIKKSAVEQGDGYIYIIDFRTPEGIIGNVPSEDIIGAFKVADGKIVANSYRGNDKHQVFTKNGLVKFPPGLDKILIEEIKNAGNEMH
uniref:Uncharacterized protein n=1 Tax=Roseihalotalea indica TaxID=2867963 RepID=A0AA49JJW1_9BACT|nr:hypothetical protein K4G66_14930 [Tunicatimonas sp. TK19036]